MQDLVCRAGVTGRAGLVWTVLLVLTGCGVSAAGKGPSDASAGDDAEKQAVAQAPPQVAAARSAADERAGEDWPKFLGPQETGVSRETGLLKTWPEEGPPLVWSRKIGTGYAAPSVLGNRLVVHHRPRDLEIVECLDAATGETFWKHEYPSDFEDPYGYNNGSRCAPLLTETRCYTFGPQGKLICLELETGKVVWEHDTASRWKIPTNFFGAGCTPILEGNLLIVLVGGQPDSGVVAFNAESGKVVWESVGKKTWDGVEMWNTGRKLKWSDSEKLVSYSSPIVATIHGERHLLCLVRQGLVSLDPRNGDVRFRYWFRSRLNDSVNAARPVVVDDQIFLTAAYDTGAALLKVHPDSAGYDVVWSDAAGMSCHWSTPIYKDGYVYGFSGRHEQEAMFQCVELQTGKLVWETNGWTRPQDDLDQDPSSGRIIDAKTKKVIPWPFFGRGSKILVGDRFIVLGERGTLALVNASSDKFEELARLSAPKLKYPCWAAPVLSRGRLFLRAEDNLICLELKAQ